MQIRSQLHCGGHNCRLGSVPESALSAPNTALSTWRDMVSLQHILKKKAIISSLQDFSLLQTDLVIHALQLRAIHSHQA